MFSSRTPAGISPISSFSRYFLPLARSSLPRRWKRTLSSHPPFFPKVKIGNSYSLSPKAPLERTGRNLKGQFPLFPDRIRFFPPLRGALKDSGGRVEEQ